MTDKEIVNGCLKNDAKYQRLLVVNFSAQLLTVSRRYTPLKLDPQDILQDAYMKIFGALHQFDPEKGKLINWMKRIVINVALKKLDKKSFKNETSVGDFNDMNLADVSYDHLDHEEIINLINSLSDVYRSVFNLSVIEGYSHKEIGKLLGIKPSTSRSNLAKAKKILRLKLVSQQKSEIWLNTTLKNL